MQPAVALSEPFIPGPAVPEPAATRNAVSVPRTVPRNVAVDAYRGFVMLLMMAEVLQLSHVARRRIPEIGSGTSSPTTRRMSNGRAARCTILIQPSFSFLVGVALPYSIASRLAKGGDIPKMFSHALWRSLVLIALGIFLRSMHSPQTYFTFEDTLTQIGLGYPFLFLLGFRPPRWQWIALAADSVRLLAGVGALSGAGPGFDYQPSACPRIGAITSPASRRIGTRTATWAARSTSGSSICFPRTKPFVDNGGGYLTLSFIPTLGTMILGLIAGRWLRDSRPPSL